MAIVRQRVYSLALGYEDLNDHDQLRRDLALQTAVEKDQVLASASTLCRFEKRAGREQAVRLHEVLLEQFIASYPRPPRRLVLDFDATDDRVHGQQERRFYHGYYDTYCFLPLYVFCGDRLLVSYLRPSKIDGAKHSWAILALLVKIVLPRRQWLLPLADASLVRERHGVNYIVGIARNKQPERAVQALDRNQLLTSEFEQSGDQATPVVDRVLLGLCAAQRHPPDRNLAGTELARAYVGTIPLKLLKIGAVVLRNTRRVQLLLSSAHPYQELFFLAAARLKPG